LAGRVRCSRPAFDELWDLGPNDKSELDTWRSVRGRYAQHIALNDGPLPPTAVSIPYLNLNYEHQLRTASFNATSIDDYERLLSVLTRPNDAHALAGVMRHFWPRFRAWWSAHGRVMVEPLYRGFAELLARRSDLTRLTANVVHFYGGDLPAGTELALDFIARPTSKATGDTSAEHVGPHLVLEALEGEAPERRISVALHELFHHCSASRTAAKKAALLERFAASTDPLAIVGYGLTEETLATTFANGLVDELVAPDALAHSLARDKGLYSDGGVDRTAKALLPHARDLLGGSIDDPAFVTTFLAAVHIAIGEAPAPREYLRTFAAGIAPTHADAMPRLASRTLAMNVDDFAFPSMDGVRMVEKHQGMTTVLFLARADLPRLADWQNVISTRDLRIIDTEAKRAGPFLYALARGIHAQTFVMVADDAPSMDRLVEALVARDTPLRGALRVN